MKVRHLRKLLDLFENEDAEVYVMNDDSPEDNNIWNGTVSTVYLARRKYVHPETKSVATRPCKETAKCEEAFVIYVKTEE